MPKAFFIDFDKPEDWSHPHYNNKLAFRQRIDVLKEEISSDKHTTK